MNMHRWSAWLLSAALCLSACQSVVPERPSGESPNGTLGTARAVEPRFLVVEAPEGRLETADIVDKATVELYYTSMKPRDTVRVEWRGSQTHSTAVQTVRIAMMLRFDIPKAWIDESPDQTVNLVYAYQVGGVGEEVVSNPLPVYVVGGQAEPVFKVMEAVDGKLNASTLGTGATAQVLHEGMAVGDTLRVTWAGVVSRNTEIKPVTDRNTPVEFVIPKAWVTENIGRAVTVFYTYQAVGNGTVVPSSPMTVQVVSNSLEDDRLVAARLDARYSNTSNDCGGRSAFFCNGVLLRTVDSGNFLSWNPSSTAISKGAVSFSFIRRDMGIRDLAWNNVQGIIFKDVDSAVAAGNLNVRVLCAFPTDAGTWGRANQGCGANPAYPTQSVYCSLLNITTVAQWRDHYYRVAGTPPNYGPRNDHQCSFLASNAQAFATSLDARGNFIPPAREREQHNELMLQLWGQNLHSQLPLEAVFYHIQRNPVSGLASARVIQRDYFNCTGKVLPLVRLSLADGAPSAFSFEYADQIVAPADVPSASACRAKESTSVRGVWRRLPPM